MNLMMLVSVLAWVGAAALWVQSHRRGGSVYVARFGVALAADWGPGEISFWAAPVDRRCVLNPVHDAWPAEMNVSTLAWFEADPSIKAYTWHRFGYARRPKFPAMIPSRLLRGKVTAVAMPFWFVIALFGVLPLARGALYVRRRALLRRRSRMGHCLTCGYDLQSGTGRCPECGIDASTPAAYPASSRRFALRTAVAAAALVLVLSLAGVARRMSQVPVATVENAPGPAAAWLRRAALEVARIEPHRRLEVYRPVIQGQVILHDSAGARTTLRSLAGIADVPRANDFDGFLHGTTAQGYAFLGDTGAFRRYALQAERDAEDMASPMFRQAIGRELATAYASLGDFESVAALVRGEPKIEDRIHMVAGIGREPATPNRKVVCNGVLPLLAEAARAAESAPDTRSLAYFFMATLSVRAADLPAAEAAAARISTPRWRAQALRRIAKAYHMTGNERSARTAYDQAAALDPAQTSEERLIKFLSQARDATSRGDRAAAAGALAAAESTAADIENPSEKGIAYAELAQMHADAGDVPACRRFLAHACAVAEGSGQDGGGTNPVLDVSMPAVAAAVAGAGDINFATEIVERLPERDRSHGFATVANRLLTRGDVDTAAKLVREHVTLSHMRPLSARYVAHAYAERQQLDRLTEWVESFQLPTERAAAMIGAAEGLSGKSFDAPLD